jgi:hypothetical protein
MILVEIRRDARFDGRDTRATNLPASELCQASPGNFLGENFRWFFKVIRAEWGQMTPRQTLQIALWFPPAAGVAGQPSIFPLL